MYNLIKFKFRTTYKTEYSTNYTNRCSWKYFLNAFMSCWEAEVRHFHGKIFYSRIPVLSIDMFEFWVASVHWNRSDCHSGVFWHVWNKILYHESTQDILIRNTSIYRYSTYASIFLIFSAINMHDPSEFRLFHSHSPTILIAFYCNLLKCISVLNIGTY